VAIVVDNSRIYVYLNGVESGYFVSDYYVGLPAFGDLVFSSNGTQNAQNAQYDEIRIWNTARTAAQVKVYKNVEFAGRIMPEGLMAYYKGDMITNAEGTQVLYDYVGNNHATLHNNSYVMVGENMPVLSTASESVYVNIEVPTTVYANVPVTFTATYNDVVCQLAWTAEGAGVDNLIVATPTMRFTSAGTHAVTVAATTVDGQTVMATCDVVVQPAPEVDASFTMTANRVAAGERITFLPVNPMAGYLYEWSMPGGDVENAYAANAATSYQTQGTYSVTLTVT
jgi:PKD repeat protein